jgi:hypothetical protein
MHLLVPFAAPLADAGRAALAALELPQLRRCLALAPASLRKRHAGDELSLTPPHEHALAQALGWAGGDGQLPWAARLAQADGIAVGAQAMALVTPVHWHVGTHQVRLIDPAALLLSNDEAEALLAALLPLLQDEGFAAWRGREHRWYLAHPSFEGLATASLDRVIGRNVDAWLGNGRLLGPLRRLQAEAQMLWHTHPVNLAREQRGLLPVNSFWLSACGVLQPERGAPPQLDARLRGPALADDWPAWCKAWETLDAGPLAEMAERAGAGQPAQLTLAGERGWLRLELRRAGLVGRLRARLSAEHPASVLEPL